MSISNYQSLEALWAKDVDDANNYKYVLDVAAKWALSDVPLTVCFLDGDKGDRVRVKKAAEQWSKAIKEDLFDFGPRRKPQDCKGEYPGENIRISFRGSSLSTYRGQLGIRKVAAHNPTMILGGFSKSKPSGDGVFTHWVLHEFGHALGLVHEHQGENSACEQEYDLEKIYEKLESPPFHWSRDEAIANIKTMYLDDVQTSPFDENSIMLYPFPTEYYKQGKKSHCYAEVHATLSEKDKLFANSFYSSIASTKQKNMMLRSLYSEQVTVAIKGRMGEQALLTQDVELSREAALEVLKLKIQSENISVKEKESLLVLLE